jgi:hypothetical protein
MSGRLPMQRDVVNTLDAPAGGAGADQASSDRDALRILPSCKLLPSSSPPCRPEIK